MTSPTSKVRGGEGEHVGSELDLRSSLVSAPFLFHLQHSGIRLPYETCCL